MTTIADLENIEKEKVKQVQSTIAHASPSALQALHDLVDAIDMVGVFTRLDQGPGGVVSEIEVGLADDAKLHKMRAKLAMAYMHACVALGRKPVWCAQL